MKTVWKDKFFKYLTILQKSETDWDSSSTLNQEMMVDISNFGISLDLNTQGNIANMEIEQTESSDETDSSLELDQHKLESREFANLQPCTDEYSVVSWKHLS